MDLKRVLQKQGTRWKKKQDHYPTTSKKLPNLGLNSWSSLQCSYPLTIRLLGALQILLLSKLKEYGLPVVLDKFTKGKSCTSQQMQQPPFMMITPGDLKVELVYINWRTGLQSQPLGDGGLIGQWAWALNSLHKKATLRHGNKMNGFSDLWKLLKHAGGRCLFLLLARVSHEYH